MLHMMTEFRDDADGEFSAFDLVINDHYIVKMVPSEDDDFFLVYLLGETEPHYIDFQDGLKMVKKSEHRLVKGMDL